MKRITYAEALVLWGRRIAAVGFITLILMGNFWATFVMTHSTAPGWLFDGFLIGAFVTFLSGLGILVGRLILMFNLQE